MWVIYAIIAAVGFGAISLLITYISRGGVESIILNAWYFLIASIMFLLIALATSAHKLKLHSSSIKWIVLLSVVAVVTNYFSVKALQSGPNTGIVRALLMIQILVAALGGIYLFHQGITGRAGIGIALVVGGLLLIVFK